MVPRTSTRGDRCVCCEVVHGVDGNSYGRTNASAATRTFSFPVVQFPNPNVAVTQCIAVILQLQWTFVGTGLIRWTFAVCGRPGEFYIVLHEHSIVQHGHPSRTKQFAAAKSRSVKNNVVSLPLRRRTRSIHQWRILPVDRRGLPIRISFVLVRVEHLNFVESHQEYAAVAALLDLS